jgi:purine-binding chemotaxis protein CheW
MIRELITFEVEGQVFGLDIMAIREIRAWTPTTRLPRVPHYVAGVVNLRGTVLPVVDLAARLGWRATEPTPRHAIIVTQLGTQIGGWIVDR